MVPGGNVSTKGGNRSQYVRIDPLVHGTQCIAVPLKGRVDDGQRLVGKRLVQQDFDGALEKACDACVVGVQARRFSGERTFYEQSVALAGR